MCVLLRLCTHAPVHSARKLAAVLGTMSSKSSISIRPALKGPILMSKNTCAPRCQLETRWTEHTLSGQTTLQQLHECPNIDADALPVATDKLAPTVADSTHLGSRSYHGLKADSCTDCRLCVNSISVRTVIIGTYFGIVWHRDGPLSLFLQSLSPSVSTARPNFTIMQN